MATDQKTFGSCCDMLKEAMSEAEFDPLIAVSEEDGVLYMSVGLIDVEEEHPGAVEYPVYYCPFCGTQVQTVEQVDAAGGGKPN